MDPNLHMDLVSTIFVGFGGFFLFMLLLALFFDQLAAAQDQKNKFYADLCKTTKNLIVPEPTSQQQIASSSTAQSSAVPSAPKQSAQVSVSSRGWWRSYTASASSGKTYSFWPALQDYMEAVQSPAQNFNDEELKNCSAVLTPLGVPRVVSGMFASVYQFGNADGSKQWALRCFDRRLDDQAERYKAISQFILADDLSFTVDFDYLEDGIKCGAVWFPVLKMHWVEGETLESFVRDNLGDKQILKELRKNFRDMMQKFRANGIAHGDLQHGNILVQEGKIYLVDYDGFYVPALAGRGSHELGHANYQHPQRDGTLFGPSMDNFSSWLIDISLLIITEDQSVFVEFNGGDECLLFRKSDLINPEESKLFAALERHESEALRSSAKKLRELLATPVTEIPYLEDDQGVKVQIEELSQKQAQA